MVNPYSNERKKAREEAREQGTQSTQRSWDNYSLGSKMEGQGGPANQPINTGETNKIINDSIASIKQSIVSEVTQAVISALRGGKTEESTTSEGKLSIDDVGSVKAPLFNYEIFSPNNGPRCGIILEIPPEFSVTKLHVLGIQGQTLRWVETQDC
jgi:hypothetical protein